MLHSSYFTYSNTFFKLPSPLLHPALIAQDSQHIRDIFYRMGFNDREIVALIGAHTLGACHADRSGYVGPWTRYSSDL